MIKLFGFMESQHPFWIDTSTGLPYASLYSTATVRTFNTFFLTTPNVLSTARSYFNCPTLIGMPFENDIFETGGKNDWERWAAIYSIST